MMITMLGKRNALLGACAAAAGVAACSAPQVDDAGPADGVAAVDGGRIAGAPAGAAGGVRRYAGVPYAAPPVGALRWRPPQPVEPWTGVRQATELPPGCPQPARPTPPGEQPFFGPGAARLEEDCLYLNVWSAAEPDDRAPVLVWNPRRRPRRRRRLRDGVRRRGAGRPGRGRGDVQLPARGARLPGPSAAARGVGARRVRELRAPRPDRGARMGPAERRGVRRRSGPGRHLRRIGGIVERQLPDGDAAGGGAVRRRRRAERRRLRADRQPPAAGTPRSRPGSGSPRHCSVRRRRRRSTRCGRRRSTRCSPRAARRPVRTSTAGC